MHEEHVELLIGKDGSVVLRHIRGGEEAARHLVSHYFGDLPPDSFRHPAIWDWVRLEPKVIDRDRLRAIVSGGESQTVDYSTQDGPRPITVAVREVEGTPHFDLPRFSLTEAHSRSAKWKWPAAIVAVVALVLVGAKLRMGQGPVYEEATFESALAALQTPPESPNLVDQFRRRDGEHHAVSLMGDDVLQCMGNGLFVQTASGAAYFLEGPGLGNQARNAMQNRQPLEVETNQGPDGPPRFLSGSGSLVPFTIHPVTLEQPTGGYTPVKGNDPNDPEKLEVGGRYTIEGGLKATPAGLLLYCPSFAQVKHIVRLDGITPELMETVVRHAVDNSLGVAAYGVITDVSKKPGRGTTYISPLSEEPTSFMRPDILRLSRRVFVKL